MTTLHAPAAPRAPARTWRAPRVVRKHTGAGAALMGGSAVAWVLLLTVPSPWAVMWLLMVVAMMWPLWLRPADRTWRATFRRWRVPAVVVLMATTTGLWMTTGIAVHLVYSTVVPQSRAWLWTTACLALVLAINRTSRRRVLLANCQRMSVIAPRGRRALRTAVRQGWRGWCRCALLCGPVMLAMVPAHDPVLMVGGSFAVWWEQNHPRSWRDPIPVWVLSVLAVLSALDGVLMGGMHG